jgi:pimeloyl-ACP methyl ester carboxylesterase
MNLLLSPLLALGAVVALSYLVERLRRSPATPAALPWAPEIPVRWVTVDGVRLRYVVAGDGPPLVLLHTLRTQLDMFQRVIPALARRYRVYALDYPGHGHSEIPAADYTADYFIGKIAAFLDRLDIQGAVLVGESIGATSALALAVRRHPRVRATVAINTYDYDRGRGAMRASALGRLIYSLNDVPVLGGTVMRLRSAPVTNAVFAGGLHRLEAFPGPLARELNQVGNRPGHYQAFMSLVHHWPTWEAVREQYAATDRPVLLLYGEHDWSRPDERAESARRIPGAELRTVANAGHFLSLDAPEDVIEQVTDFIGRLPSTPAAERASG